MTSVKTELLVLYYDGQSILHIVSNSNFNEHTKHT